MSDKLNINNEMAQLDRKNRGFYDELTDEERKKFSLYLMLRWSSAVQAAGNIQSYYVMSCNENLNKNYFNISKHPKLQWLCATAVSPGMGKQNHYWQAAKKKEGSNNKAIKFLTEQFPELKDDEIKLLAELNDKSDLTDMARKLGWDDKRIKSDL